MTNEEWRDIPDFEGLYQVSNRGNVRRLTQDRRHRTGAYWPVTQHLPRDGYLYVTLSAKPRICKRFSVHYLVTLTFLGPRPANVEVHHRDHRRTNNHLLNLEYVTRQQNLEYSRHLLPRGERHPNAKLTTADVEVIRSTNLSQRVLAKRYGVAQTTIGRIKSRRH